MNREIERIIEEVEIGGTNYMSDMFGQKVYSILSSMGDEDRKNILNEIKKSSTNQLFLPGRFYNFYYYPLFLKRAYEEYYDKNPFVFVLKREENIIHGLNLNYLDFNRRNKLLNKFFRYFVGDYENLNPFTNKILLNYKAMNAKSNFIEQKIIYRKYYINRINIVHNIPIRYVKIMSVFDEVSDFTVSKDLVYRLTLNEYYKNLKTETKKGKRQI